MQNLKSLTDAIRYFSDEQVCIDTVAAMRWLDGKPMCPHCKSQNHYWLAAAKRWKCAKCRKQFSVKVGTIFEDSPLKLDKWLTSLWLLANCKNGISSYEVARDLGITQKSAWFMLHRIRYALKTGSIEKIGSSGGPVEIDEFYMGPKLSAMHRKRRRQLQVGDNYGKHKVPVIGMLDREAKQVRAQVVPNIKRDTLQNAILDKVSKGSTIYTDNSVLYDNLEAKEYIHETVTHMDEYVRGQVHTQGIENFWSLLKRGLKGTYVAVEPFHMDRYLDEQVFRFNNRATKDNPLTDYDRFTLALSQISGKRLTYAELIGKEGETAI